MGSLVGDIKLRQVPINAYNLALPPTRCCLGEAVASRCVLVHGASLDLLYQHRSCYVLALTDQLSLVANTLNCTKVEIAHNIRGATVNESAFLLREYF